MSDHGKKDDHKKDEGKPKGGGDDAKKSGKPDKEAFAAFWAIPFFATFKDFFKSFLDIDLSSVLSWFDDESEAFASQVAKALSKRVTKNSFLRSWVIRKLSSVAINQFEKLGEGQPSMVHSLIEKFSDFFEHVRSCFFADMHIEEAEKVVVMSPELEKAFAEFDKAFLANAAQALAEIADPAERSAAGAKFLGDYTEVFAPLKEIMVSGVPKPHKEEEPTEPEVPFRDRLEDVCETIADGIEPVNEQLRSVRAKLKAHNDAKQATLAAIPKRTETRIERGLKKFFGVA